jgi:membrane protein required for colicin V production
MSFAALTGWDWFVTLVCLLSVLLGLWRGMVRTVFGLAAWIVALIGAPMLGPGLVETAGLQAHPWVVFTTLFVALLVGVRVLGSLLARAMGSIGLGGADRGLGAALGAARALVVITLAVAGARALDLHHTEAWRTSLSRPLLDRLVLWIEPYLPQRISGIRET